MTQTKFSVVIATIGSSYLEKIVGVYLDSTLSVEVILVFDNPEVKPEDFLSQAQQNDSRVKILANEANLGIACATNRGLTAASGEIILRNDDDDIPSPDRLREVEDYFLSHPEVVILYSFAEGVDVGTGRTWKIKGPLKNEEIQTALLQRNFIVHSTVALRSSAGEKIGFYDKTFRFALDYDLYLRAIRAGLVFGCIPKVLVTRLYHKDSITVAKRKRQILHSMAARLLHNAQVKDDQCVWPVIARYALLLAIPDWARKLRRRLGHGK